MNQVIQIIVNQKGKFSVTSPLSGMETVKLLIAAAHTAIQSVDKEESVIQPVKVLPFSTAPNGS